MRLNILYTINKFKVNNKGLCGLTCRLTYLKVRKQFSTGQFVTPDNWNSKRQLIKPPEPDSEYINTQLSLIRQNLNQAFLFLQVKGSSFTVLDIYKQYKVKTPLMEKNMSEYIIFL